MRMTGGGKNTILGVVGHIEEPLHGHGRQLLHEALQIIQVMPQHDELMLAAAGADGDPVGEKHVLRDINSENLCPWQQNTKVLARYDG